MEEQAILALGTVTLVGCGVGLVLIHSNNRLLKGLNWMGAALAAGGLAALFALITMYLPPVRPISNFLIILAFTLCYRADQLLIGRNTERNRLSLVLLVIDACLAPLRWAHLISVGTGVAVLSVLCAIQLAATSRLVAQESSAESRQAAQFTAGLMRLVLLACIARGVLAACGFVENSPWAYVEETCAAALFTAGGIGMGFCFFWRTTTKLTEELEHMASTDPLTRVYNRRVFLKWCERELARSQESGQPFSVLLVDFDHFKRINDNFGHHVGDEVLCRAVERIQDSIRGIDVLCRWGGEEFAVLLPNASAAATLIVAERVRQNVRTVKLSASTLSKQKATQLQLTISVGAATYDHGLDEIEAMLQRADEALYEAKSAGRDRVVLSSSSIGGSPYLSTPHHPSFTPAPVSGAV